MMNKNNTTAMASKKTLLFVVYFVYKLLQKAKQITTRSSSICRTRRDVSSIFQELGPYYTRRAFRMNSATFWELHKVLYPLMKYNVMSLASSKKGKIGVVQTNGARNGLIPSSIRLSCALRFFAGWSVYDIAVMHGISVSQVYISVWRVVDAVNNTKSLDIKFPTMDEQEYISTGFKLKSQAVASLGACPVCPLYHIRSFISVLIQKEPGEYFRMLKRSPQLSVTHYKILPHVTSR